MQAQIRLGQPLVLANGQIIKNRLAKSAMSEALGTADGLATPALAALYRRWAEGGLGLCITGNVMIDHRALGEPGNVVVEDERGLAALQRWAQAGTAHETQLWMQINHPGKQTPKGLNLETVAPSAVPFRPDLARWFATPRALTHAEIEALVQRFATSAALAQRAGFTGVQIHGAHGYLVSQFLSPLHNLRSDAWGGSADKRRRFVLQVLAAIRERVGPAFPIGIKLNSADFQRGGFSEDESLECIQALQAGGIDLIEISGGSYESPVQTGVKPVSESTRAREAYFLSFAEKARAATSVPLMLTGGFRSLQGMADALSSQAIDLVGLARCLAIEPDLPKRLLGGLEPQHQVKMRKTGLGLLDKTGLMEVAWYTRQLHRMAQGRDPLADESTLKVFALFVMHNLWHRASLPARLRA